MNRSRYVGARLAGIRVDCASLLGEIHRPNTVNTEVGGYMVLSIPSSISEAYENVKSVEVIVDWGGQPHSVRITAQKVIHLPGQSGFDRAVDVQVTTGLDLHFDVPGFKKGENDVDLWVRFPSFPELTDLAISADDAIDDALDRLGNLAEMS